MKTLVDINKDILDEAMKLSDAKTKKEVINMALDELIKSNLRQKLKELAGSGVIEANLSGLKKNRKRRERGHRNLQMIKR
jgi:Arc/MetJ family transcription regulator